MQMMLLVEPIEGGRFRARVGEPFCVSVEGDTADEATEKLRASLDALFERGARLATITVANGKPTIGAPLPFPADDLYKTDWVYRELQEEMAENRRQDEALNP